MKRLAVALVVSALSAAPTQRDPFVEAWDEWAALANARAMRVGTIDAREPIAWARVKSEFRKLEKQMDAMYRGER